VLLYLCHRSLRTKEAAAPAAKGSST
jgi:hypothetical protein